MKACDPKVFQSSLVSVATALERGDWPDIEYLSTSNAKPQVREALVGENKRFYETVHHPRGVEKCKTRREFANVYLSMSAMDKTQLATLLLNSCVNQIGSISRMSRIPSQSLDSGSLALAHPITIVQARASSWRIDRRTPILYTNILNCPILILSTTTHAGSSGTLYCEDPTRF